MAVSKDRVVKEKEPPYVRVMQIIEAKKAALPSAYELTPQIDITETVNSPVPKEPLGGPILGTITVKTTIVVHLQSIASFFKLDQIKLSASSTCPYTWVMKSQTTL